MRLVVLGGGESGVGTAILGKKKGYDVFVSDFGKIKENYKEVLSINGIAWEDEKHTEDLILSADVVMKSPGIPDKAPIVKKLLEKNIPVISEIEFAAPFTTAKTIGITGSNGKTTTTLLTYHILKQGGLNVGLAGNIGKSFAWQVAENKHDCYVLELSSFQLDGILNYKPDIAIILNISPDHLDRYNYDYKLYIDSKFRITMNQTETDFLIYDEDDEDNYMRTNGYVEDGAGNGDKEEDTMLAQLADGEFVTRTDGVLGAGILAGASPKDPKEMRKLGAEFFYEQQKRFKRIYDLLDASRKARAN